MKTTYYIIEKRPIITRLIESDIFEDLDTAKQEKEALSEVLKNRDCFKLYKVELEEVTE